MSGRDSGTDAVWDEMHIKCLIGDLIVNRLLLEKLTFIDQTGTHVTLLLFSFIHHYLPISMVLNK